MEHIAGNEFFFHEKHSLRYVQQKEQKNIETTEIVYKWFKIFLHAEVVTNGGIKILFSFRILMRARIQFFAFLKFLKNENKKKKKQISYMTAITTWRRFISNQMRCLRVFEKIKTSKKYQDEIDVLENIFKMQTIQWWYKIYDHDHDNDDGNDFVYKKSLMSNIVPFTNNNKIRKK